MLFIHFFLLSFFRQNYRIGWQIVKFRNSFFVKFCDSPPWFHEILKAMVSQLSQWVHRPQSNVSIVEIQISFFVKTWGDQKLKKTAKISRQSRYRFANGPKRIIHHLDFTRFWRPWFPNFLNEFIDRRIELCEHCMYYIA